MLFKNNRMFFVAGATAMLFLCNLSSYAQGVRTGFYAPTGPRVELGALEPTLRKWYVPQELYLQYRWQPWEYTNYAKEHYQKYVKIELEGTRYYDIFGNYITRGWEIYHWDQVQPRMYQSRIRKSPKYSTWFDNVLISSVSRGQYYTAITIADEIRTTLTPLTFSKPAFNGVQWDFLSDKYAFTALASRINLPSYAVLYEENIGDEITNYTNLFGFRGTVQVGDFAKAGITYVNAHHGSSAEDFGSNSFKGILSGPSNTGWVERIMVRISDDSPEDTPGAILYREEVWIDGQYHPEVTPDIEGGVFVEGTWRVSGTEQMVLTYDLQHKSAVDYKQIKKVEIVLVLANDYFVEISSNLQTNLAPVPSVVFLPVARAEGNVKDGSNQQMLRIRYGLPTGNEIYGVTFEINDVGGFNLRAEYDINRRFRRFPNENIPGTIGGKEVKQHSLAIDKSSAFYLQASLIAYPWFAYGEIFNIDDDYSTSMFIEDSKGQIDYENATRYRFDFVDDNDDQDRFPDWQRANQPAADRAVFPGMDENNDLVFDFNQNNNLQPDYEEPFLKYNVDPPEFLFGMDMNNNGTVDRFEDDHEADLPYKKGHKGYNIYGGVEIVPNIGLKLGHLEERLVSSDRRSLSTYGVFTVERDYARVGKLWVCNIAKKVKDDIPDPIYLWVQPSGSAGESRKVDDPLLQRDTFVNTAYLRFDYLQIPKLRIINKIKYEIYDQAGAVREEYGASDQRFFGLINKMDYTQSIGENLVIRPKWKGMYEQLKRDGELEKRELTEILFLVGTYNVSARAWLEGGYQGTIFWDLVDAYNNYYGTVFAIQFTNTSDFLGYAITAKLGFRWERLDYTDEGRADETSTVAFIRIYAGVE